MSIRVPASEVEGAFRALGLLDGSGESAVNSAYQAWLRAHHVRGASLFDMPDMGDGTYRVIEAHWDVISAESSGARVADQLDRLEQQNAADAEALAELERRATALREAAAPAPATATPTERPFFDALARTARPRSSSSGLVWIFGGAMLGLAWWKWRKGKL